MKVQDPKGAPIPDAKVVFFDEHQRKFFSSDTSDKGLCRFTSSAPTNWAVPGRVLVFKKDFALGGGAVKKGANSFQLSPPGSLRGICKAASGKAAAGTKVRVIQIMPQENAKPLSGMMVLFRSPLEEQFSTVTDAQGRWSFSGVPEKGRALVEFEHADYTLERVIIPLGVEFPLLMRPKKPAEPPVGD